MPYIYLISCVFLGSTTSIFGALYNQKNSERRDPSPLYNFLLCLAALVGWVLLFFAFGPSFDIGVIPYAVGFGVSYALCMIGLLNALRTGPVSLTTLIIQLSLIATTVWGFFFWDTPFSLLVGIGLILVVISLWLSLYTGKKVTEETGKISLKWIVFTLLGFAGNSGCAIIQKSQQLAFQGKHGNLLMMCALLFSTLFTLFLYIRSDKTDSRKIIRTTAHFPIASGLCNVIHNLFIIFLATSTIPPSIIYPVLAVSGLSLTGIFSLFIFKEKLRWWQWLGIVVGAVAVVLLSL